MSEAEIARNLIDKIRALRIHYNDWDLLDEEDVTDPWLAVQAKELEELQKAADEAENELRKKS